ncbi:hypothetical protein GY45DRAFT_1327114 [Cubamyces sp. BRFM 1775]|nr:hypothetical protein GY45DRAFT_1327114 [Cubamyces sp. BRFM 1775]
MAAVSSSQSSRIASPEIIDVDALDDDGIVYAGYNQRHPPQPVAGPSAGPSSSAHAGHDDEVTYTGFRVRSPRRASRAHSSARAGPSVGSSGENAIVLDDDEYFPVPGSSRRSHRHRSRLFSPPPPPAQRGHTPGVPPLPPHLAAQASHPRRHRAHVVPPPIRPLPNPLPFEAGLPPARQRLPPRNEPPPPAAAPRSHHQPAMGLGGALIALNRQNAIQEANRANRERERASRGFNLPSFTDILRRMTGFGDEGSEPARPEANGAGWRSRLWPWSWGLPTLEAEHDVPFPFEADEPWIRMPDRIDGLRFGGGAFDPGRFGPVPEKVALWKPEYTHPYKLGPGFAHDFAPPEEPTSGSSPIVLDEDAAGPSNAGSSSSSATAIETTLVCGQCLDPLVLAPADGSSSEDLKMRRVWALRCGHMLDGKCIAGLMVPPEAQAAPVSVEPSEEQLVASGKGKGKAMPEADQPMASEMPAAKASSPEPDRKGKRRAVDPPEGESPAKRPAPSTSTPPAATTNPSSSVAEPQPNSIRSRLRSHARSAADVSPSEPSAPGTSAHVTPPTPASASAPAVAAAEAAHPARRSRRQPGLVAPPAPAHLAAHAHAHARHEHRRDHGHGRDRDRERERGHGHGHGHGRSRGKGKARAKVERPPVIEAEHEWRCPVAGCGCVHYSVRVGGVWKTDEGRGPIALFV